MAAAANTELVRRWWEEVWNERRYDVADEVLAPDFEIHARWSNPTKGGPNDEGGIGPCNNDIRRWGETCPDFRVTIDKMLDAGDLVGCVHTIRGSVSLRIDG